MPHSFPAALASLLILAGCVRAPVDEGGLRIEDRPTEGVVRIFNPARTPTRLYYGWTNGFDDDQMFWIRFRDGAGNGVHIDGGSPDGWWSPLAYRSTAYGPGEGPERRELVIPAAGFLDMPIDVGRIMGRIRDGRLSVRGPCEIQIMLQAYPGRRGWEPMRLQTDWRPSDCPEGA